MGRAVRTPLARDDLKEIGRYIARKSQNRDVAARFLDTVERRLKLLATQPEMGELRPDLGQGIRCFSIDDYAVFYRQVAADIEILRVLHGSRDVPSAWRSARS